MTDPDKPELERASGGMTDPDKPDLERASGGMADPGTTELERASGGMADPGKTELERASGGMADPGKTELERASGGMADPGKTELERASGEQEPVSLTRQVLERQGDNFEISGCGQVNITMNQEHTYTLPNFMAHYQEDYEILFVPTSPFFACQNTLDDHPALMITGAPGSGKTMIAQQLMVKLWDVKKCHPFRVTKPSDYTKNRNPEIQQVFHIDDIFGSSNFVQGKYDAWVPLFGIMRDDIRSKNTFIIFTSRHNILKANLTDLKNYEVFRYVINVSDKKFKLTEENKKDIFQNHAKSSQLGIGYDDIVAHTQMKDASDAMGYPQRVHLLCAMKDETRESKIRYFCHPMEFLSNIIGSYKEKDHLSYCVLILLLITDGKLPVSYLHPSNKSSKQVQTCMEICHLSPITNTMGELRDTAENLCGSFLILNDGFYVFQHECIMEASTLHFGQFYPSYILDRCSMQFLRQRVFTKVSAPPENEYVVTLPSDTYRQLCARLLKEITRCVCVEGKELSEQGDPISLISLSTYRVFRDPAFLCVFLLHLQDMTSLHILLTSTSRPSQHPTFLFFAAASGQDTLIQEILSSCKVQQLPGFNDHLDHVLYAACSGGSPASVRKLLEIGARTDFRTAQRPDDVSSYPVWWNQPFTCTTLMHAAYSGNIEVLRLIVDHLQRHQVDMVEHSSLRDDRARTALHWWALGGRGAAGTLQMLQEAGADLQVTDKDGDTALHLSARWGHEASIRALVEAGADVNLKTKGGWTALHLSARRGDEASIRLLVEAGADVNVVDEDGRTALHLSADEASIRPLVEAGADVNVRTKGGHTALHLSALLGHEASIRALVKAGADVNVVDEDGWTALHLSTLSGYEASIRLLVEAGADINVGANDGETALHFAAEDGQANIVRLLVEAGADINVRKKDGQTALHVSSQRGHEASLRVLVKAGADVNVGNNDGETALHFAAVTLTWWTRFSAGEKGQANIVRLLVEAGADIHLRASSSRLRPYTDLTPLEVADLCGYTAVADYLRSLTSK